MSQAHRPPTVSPQASATRQAPRDILPFAGPQPETTRLGHARLGERILSIVTRTWAEDRPNCMNPCPQCTAYRGVCTVAVPRDLTLEEARNVRSEDPAAVSPGASCGAPGAASGPHGRPAG